jgi:hypothetical protein
MKLIAWYDKRRNDGCANALPDVAHKFVKNGLSG